ncbi:MAG: RNA 3'-terminal phosphate cyclase [Candidatus Binatia bacterium]|nr:RNA 3'-terminal phosphate cyclase [Candidatus Binatia bacterium]
MVVLDGALGEGGGQILRTALTLSVLTGRHFRMFNIRARRSRPGLLRQHLAAVRAAAAISGAETDGDVLGSQELVFRPQRIRGGSFEFDVGSAGSATLVLQTVMIPLLCASEPSHVVCKGGTHNPAAPPYDFVASVYLPVLRRMGANVTATLQRYGFYPRGGGRFTVEIEPLQRWLPLELTERGALQAVLARALVADLPPHIAHRELQVVREMLGWRQQELVTEVLPPGQGPGNVLLLSMEGEHLVEMAVGFGQKGVRAEEVAREACAAAHRYLSAGVPVGVHLADQLLLPLALAKGRFRTLAPSSHTETNRLVIEQFLDCSIRFEQRGTDDVLVSVG